MKYRTRILTCIFLSLTCLLSGVVFSQVPNPTSAPIQVDEQPTPTPGKDDKKSKKTGFIRIWNYSYLKEAPGIAVFLGAPGAQVPAFDMRIWLARGSKSPEQRSWMEVPPGQYEIFVLADDAVPGNMGVKIGADAPPSSSLLKQRQGLKIEGDSHQTIVLFEKGGHLVARVLDDAAVTPGITHLRVFTFETTLKPTISELANDGSKILMAQNVDEEGADVELKTQHSPVTLEVSYPLRPDFISRQNVEIDFAGYKSCSIIFAPDRYGAVSAEFTNDAPIPPPSKTGI